jgi:CHAT domain-containing protein
MKTYSLLKSACFYFVCIAFIAFPAKLIAQIETPKDSTENKVHRFIDDDDDEDDIHLHKIEKEAETKPELPKVPDKELQELPDNNIDPRFIDDLDDEPNLKSDEPETQKVDETNQTATDTTKVEDQITTKQKAKDTKVDLTKEQKKANKEYAKRQDFLEDWYAQTFKVEKDFEHGKYWSNVSRARRMKRQAIKQHNDSSLYAIALIIKAEQYEALGRYKEAIELFEKGTQSFEKHCNPDSAYYTRAVQIIATAAMNMGKNAVAQEYIFIANDCFKFSPLDTDTFEIVKPVKKEKNKEIKQWEPNYEIEYYNILDLQIINNINRGFYTQAVELIPRYKSYLKNNSKKHRVFEDSTYVKALKVKNDKKLRKRNINKLAKLYMLEADLLRLKGDYFGADTLYSINSKQIKKLTGKKSIYYIGAKYNQALLALDRGDIKRVHKALEKSRKSIQTSNQISRSSKFYYEAYETELMSYLAINDVSTFKNRTKKLKQNIRVTFPKKSPQYINVERINNEMYVRNKAYKRAERNLLRLRKKEEEIMPQYHPDRKKINNQQIELYKRLHRYADVRQLILNNITIEKIYNGEESPAYLLEILHLAIYDVTFSNEFNEAEHSFDKAFIRVIRDQLHPFHKDYIPTLSTLAKLYDVTDRYDKAIDLLEEAIDINKRKYKKPNQQLGSLYQVLSHVYINKGEFEKAEVLLKSAIDIIKDDAGRKNIEYINALRTLGILYNINGNFSEAEKVLRQAHRISKKLGLDDMPDISNTDDLVELYIKTGKYDDADELLKNTIKIKEIKYGKSHFQLITPYNQLGRLNLIRGDFVNAEKAIVNAMEIAQVVFSDSSSRYIENLSLLSKVYTDMGEYSKAKEINFKVVELTKNKFGENHINLANAYENLAIIKLYSNDSIAEIKELLDKALEIYRNALESTEHPKFAEIMQILAIAETKDKEYDNADMLLKNAGEILEKKFGKRSDKMADNHILQGDVHYQRGSFENSIKDYEHGLSIYKKVFNDKHPLYVAAQVKLAKAHFALKEYDKTMKILDETNAKNLEFMAKFFPSLSDNEKNSYWNSIKESFDLYNSLAINMLSSKKEVVQKMYNNRLATKAILLSSSIKVKERIMNSGDEKLIDNFTQYNIKREILTRSFSMSQEELHAAKINVSQLEKQVSDLEKKLSEESELFADKNDAKQFTWQDVSKALKPNEKAIEIIRLRYFDTDFTDSVLYAALILSPKSKTGPELILLTNGNELEGRYYKYYRNGVKLKAKDRFSYEQYWKAIDAKLNQPERIYFSADGIYNQLNIETFQLDNGNYLFDKYTVYIVSNTKDLAIDAIKGKPVYTGKTAMFFGNPSFSDTTSQHLNPLASLNKVSSIEPLPGAEKEVNAINQLLEDQDWETKIYVLDEATEELAKKSVSPRVFHIATHGFFMEESQTSTQLEYGQKKSDNSLLKSGLLFVGAAELLEEENEYGFNRKDGILTAYEAMNLNFDHTEIVVLSACETGLGEVRSGEGVFGLQRSFLVAGARNVIMTLFKVDDEVTKELMKHFYTEWLETGDKRAAFNNAKRKIKDKYDSSIYWGSFVMIGLD